MNNNWRAVTSPKPRRVGEAFVMRGDTFVLKVYKGSVPDTMALARYLARQFNKIEAKRMLTSQPDLFQEVLGDAP